jgi:hypothetical protein
MGPRRALRILSLLTVLAFAACASAPQPKWFEVPVRGLSNEEVHERCLFALRLTDFKVAKSDLKEGRIESQWNESLVPFHRPKGEGSGGFRVRAIMEIQDAADANKTDTNKTEVIKTDANKGGNAKTVRVRVERERNEEIKHPGDPAQAKWEPDADDANLAQRLAVNLKERVTPFSPSEDFYSRYGLDKEGKEISSTSKPKGP